MEFHPEVITAILNTWGAPKYDGSQDVRLWLREIEKLCRRHSIPPTQMTEMAVRCTAGQASLVLVAMFEAKIAEDSVWSWADFEACVIQIEENMRGAPRTENMRDAQNTDSMRGVPQDVGDGGFRSQHPYASAALLLVGTGLALPAVGVGILGAVGFGAGGVAAGSLAAIIQSVVYGGATGGLFSVFQYLGATAVAPPLFQTLAGLGTATAGAWLGSSNDTREGREGAENPPAEEGTTPRH